MKKIIPMSNKTQAMKDAIEFAFPGTKKAIEENKCPMCKKPITAFRDESSKKEYAISGMCQKCQDQVFG
jgi:hypothetical protein